MLRLADRLLPGLWSDVLSLCKGLIVSVHMLIEERLGMRSPVYLKLKCLYREKEQLFQWCF